MRRTRVWLVAGLVVTTAACARHAKRLEPEPFDPSTPPLPVLWDVMVPKRTSPGGSVVGQTECATRLVMHERRGASTRVSRNEETFWIDDADLERAPRAYVRCAGPLVLRDSRVSDALVRSLTPPVLVEIDPWPDFDPTLPPAILERDDDERSCAELRFTGDKLASPAIVWGFSRQGDRELRLTGPTIKDARLSDDGIHLVHAPGEEVGYLCLEHLFVARRTKEMWELISLSSSPKGDVWAYSPASATRWYATRAACEKGLARGAVAKLPFHGCL